MYSPVSVDSPVLLEDTTHILTDLVITIWTLQAGYMIEIAGTWHGKRVQQLYDPVRGSQGINQQGLLAIREIARIDAPVFLQQIIDLDQDVVLKLKPVNTFLQILQLMLKVFAISRISPLLRRFLHGICLLSE